ncbi:hypothetical protein EDD27_7985 [Nonomuraea polychroma]|uniref:Ricin-type beta-trefoil lectin protein n=1 Tax=Nonomuraea polychroma TaxID=46176 RepID=A0A438MH82_9ACTN|nr:hypothetical protein EDD27_7985 [Nonomuraea polychroma]
MGPRAISKPQWQQLRSPWLSPRRPAAVTQSGSSQLSGTVEFPIITHVQSGKCLDGSISQGVRLNTCNGSDYQHWS